MENLEDVLQALDEFQKMRPSEIPRELEEYLCWVAKTGDPVYQWSLIKTLFREKLTRVMTDFYESCPSLDLTPCPNVELFNYDTMKSNLLERLESFANAPFTVQRICELLTAPRKEYNRVDKFMRAIEKNILVVSTREPGPIGRRNENGDGMVNGSIDEDTSVTEPPQDVEMEYWEKDCPSTVTLSVHTVENETPLLHTVVPTTTVVKNVFGTDELSQEKAESASSKSDMVVSNFIPTASEFSNVSNLNSQTEVQESHIGSTIQNLSTIVPETSGIVSDVSEAIMNEDTSSQPSLEMDNEGSDAVDPSRKLQTTFQTKDFVSHESKRFCADNSKVSDKPDVGAIPIQAQDESSKSDDTLIKPDMEPEIALDNKESVSPIVENFLSANDNLEDAIKPDIEVGCAQPIINTSGSSIEHKETLPLESESVQNTSAINNLEQSTGNLISPTDVVSIKETMNVSESMDVKTEENLQEQSKEAESTEDPKPIVEEPCSKDDATENLTCDQEKESFAIIEATENETTVIKSIVPDPIPIIEEPKNVETINAEEDAPSIMEIREDLDDNSSVICQSESTERMSLEENTTDQQTNDITVTVNNIKDSDTTIETDISKKEQGAVELMDIDEEKTLSVFQQNDEPMEQETAQSSKS